MKKFIEKLKNIGGIIKFLSFLSDWLATTVQVYEKHFPQVSTNEVSTNENKENKERK